MSLPIDKERFCRDFQGGFCPFVSMGVPRSWCERVCKGKWRPEDPIQPEEFRPKMSPIIAKPPAANQTPIQQISFVKEAKNALAAFIRAGKNNFKMVDEKTFIERKIACTTCGGTIRCPNCGCLVGLKSKLESERTCPNPQTYPGLDKYPPRNYWEVCGQKTTAIVIGRNEPIEWWNKTIADLFATATGKLEVIAVVDGPEPRINTDFHGLKIINNSPAQGRRKGINQAAAQATGDYLFIIDAHCRMSEGWDTRLKCACDENTIAVSTIRAMVEDFENELAGHLYGFAYLNPDCVEKWLSNKPTMGPPLIETMMGFTGCAWMIRREDFFRLGGYDESLGEYGYDGPEWALKIQFAAGGKVVLRKDVTCWHIFGTNTGGKLYKTSMLPISAFKNAMVRKYGEPAIRKLAEKFFPLPEWSDAKPLKTIICCLSGISDNQVVEYCLKQLRELPFDKSLIIEARRPEEPPCHRTYYAQLLRALDSPAGRQTEFVFIAEHDILYSAEHFNFTPKEKNMLYYDLAHCQLDKDGFFRFGKYLTSMLVANRELLMRLLQKRIKAIDAGWQLTWAEPGIEEPDDEQIKIETYRSTADSIDIRHERNFTGGQAGEHFEELAGWGNSKNLWKKLKPENLLELFIRYNAEKMPEHGPFYEKLFAPYIDDEIVIVEIGVGTAGGSGKAFLDYLHKAIFIGVDCEERPIRKTNRYQFIKALQEDPRLPELMRSKTHLPISFIIDDGGHRNYQQIQTFENLFPILRPGGFYIIEDLHVSGTNEYFRDDYRETVKWLKNLPYQKEFYRCHDFDFDICVIRKPS